MKNKYLFYILPYFFFSINCFSQGGFAWNNPLKMARSSDGITFNTPQIFQDSSGVPSVIHWRGDTLIAAFQWFRLPNPSRSWDRVATKFSYDRGTTWSQPIPIVVNGLPTNYQRPFDPTLVVLDNQSIRIYFSSSIGMPMGGLDYSVNTYSAISKDGINFIFEPNPRVDELSKQVIDPAVIYFNSVWHFLAPIGSPQQGAYHYLSSDGLNFVATSNIPSDNSHNWTGNYVLETNTELRFYGSGQKIWYNSSSNGDLWSGYVNTNIQGGDPSVVKISNKNYLMVYVGQPYIIVGNQNNVTDVKMMSVFPNPLSSHMNVISDPKFVGTGYIISNNMGQVVLKGNICCENILIDLSHLPVGIYFFIAGEKNQQIVKLTKE